MEKGTQYTDFIGLESGPLREAGTTTFCQCATTLQWTITTHKAPETAWSLAPFRYTPNNQPCLCLRYKNAECGVSKLKTAPSLDSMKPSKQRREASLSISKNLKFGIERILNQDCSSGRYIHIKDIFTTILRIDDGRHEKGLHNLIWGILVNTNSHHEYHSF